MKTFFELVRSYSDLGYDVCLTSLYGKDAVRMVKRWSHPAEKSLVCEQIIDHDSFNDLGRANDILNYMYQNIQDQEETGKYYESTLYSF